MASKEMPTSSDGGVPLKELPEPQTIESLKRKQSPMAPQEGIVAWLQCAAGFCIFFNTWGLLNSFGMIDILSLRSKKLNLDRSLSSILPAGPSARIFGL